MQEVGPPEEIVIEKEDIDTDKKKEYLSLLKKSAIALTDSDYQTALDDTELALVLYPNDPPAQNMKEKILKEQETKRNNFDRFLRAAEDNETAGQLIDAQTNYRKALEIFNRDEVRLKAAAIEKQLNEYRLYLDKGHDASGGLTDVELAMQMFQKAKAVWDNPEVNHAMTSLVENVKAELDKNLDQARLYVNDEHLNAAYDLTKQSLDTASKLDLTDKVSEAKQVLYKIQWIINPGNLGWKKIAAEQIETVDIQQHQQTQAKRIYTNSVGMKFVYITDGSYYISTMEVTQSQWRSLIGDGPEWFTGKDLPVSGISWTDAMGFCNKLSIKEGLDYQLPTLHQWSQACGCGRSDKYSCGSTISPRWANYSPSPGDSVAPKSAGSYPANVWGLYDMHGNVSEWCREQDTLRTAFLMGGSYRSPAQRITSGFSETDSVNAENKSYGFRVVIELDKKSN